MADSTNIDPAIDQPLAERTHYDPETGIYRTAFDPTADSVVVTIVETVAYATDQELTTLPPLFGTVDPESIANLISGSSEGPVEVTFMYIGCQVTISSDGECIVNPEST